MSLRGYDRDEVDAFLDEVAASFSELLEDGGSASVDADEGEPAADVAVEPEVEEPQPVAAAPASESPFAAIGAETQRILDAAQEAAEEIRKRAQTEADQAREEALAAAQKEVAFLREQASATQDQIDALVARRSELAQRLEQARETVDVALMELEENVEETAATDASNSVLAEAAEPDEADAESGTSEDEE